MNAEPANGAATTWTRLAALAIATLFVLCGAAAIALAYSHSIIADFVDFWAAGRLASEGHAASAYDMAVHHAVQAQVVPNVGILPFPYPPFVLPILIPFGMLPFWIAFALWLITTASLYLAATRRLLPVRFLLAQAAAAANFITGQAGFLTSAIFIGGTALLARRPLTAGAILGLLSVKPQLAVLLPVALIAGREWRAIAGGIASSIALLALAFLLFGIDAYGGFLANLPQYSHWLNSGRWPWGELASMFAMLRGLGVPKVPAMVIHGLGALAAAGLTARAWRLKLEARVPILAAATLLVSPYMFTYDALLLTVPLAWLLRHDARWEFTAVWLLSLLPVVGYFTQFPNMIPLAAVIALWALHQSRDGERVIGDGSYQV